MDLRYEMNEMLKEFPYSSQPAPKIKKVIGSGLDLVVIHSCLVRNLSNKSDGERQDPIWLTAQLATTNNSQDFVDFFLPFHYQRIFHFTEFIYSLSVDSKQIDEAKDSNRFLKIHSFFFFVENWTFKITSRAQTLRKSKNRF